MTMPDNRTGIILMVVVTFIFAMQDGISRHLAGSYNVIMVIMIRYWFFAAFVVAVAARKLVVSVRLRRRNNRFCRLFGAFCWPQRSV